MSKCASCGEELEYGAKFCTKCGSEILGMENDKIDNFPNLVLNIFMKILVLLVLIFLGFFVYTIIKVVISLLFMMLIKFNIVGFNVYQSIEGMLPFLSIILAIFVTPTITNLKTIKEKVIVGVFIVLLGTIGAVWISSSQYKARQPAPITHTTYSGCLNANQRENWMTENQYLGLIDMCKKEYNITY